MSIELELEKMGENSVRASKDIRSLNERDKNNILKSIIVSLEKNKKNILDANSLDISNSENSLSKAMIDRLIQVISLGPRFARPRPRNNLKNKPRHHEA